MADNPKKDHHFIPRFHISRWCNDDGKMVVYRKFGAGRIVPREKSPAQLGYREYLYSLVKSHDPTEYLEQHDEIEDKLGLIDDAAATASSKMINGGIDTLTPGEKLDWARYVVSLTMRTPEKIKEIRQGYLERKNPILGDNFWDSDNWEDISMRSHVLSMIHNQTLHEMYNEIATSSLAEDICKYSWAIVESVSDEVTFVLTPDPVWRNTLSDGYTHAFGIPLTPNKYWIAYRQDWKDTELLRMYACGYNLFQAEKCPEFIISSEPLVSRNTYRWKKIFEDALQNHRDVNIDATVRSWAAGFLEKLDSNEQSGQP